MLFQAQAIYILAALVAIADLAACIAIESTASLNTRDLPRPRFGNVPYGVYLTRCTAKGKIALTFDDGPGDYTEKVLDTLEKNDVKATFFLVGSNGKNGISNPSYTSVLKRMLNAGHHLGSHSWSHQNFDAISQQQRIDEIVKNEDIFAKTLGIIPTYFRPPYTHCSSDCISVLNNYAYHITDLSLDTKDWLDDGVNAKQIYSSAIKSSNPATDSFVCLAHDIHPFTADGFAQYMIDVAKAKGFQLTTLGDCLGDPPSNWYRDPKTGGPKEVTKSNTNSESKTASSTGPATVGETKSTSSVVSSTIVTETKSTSSYTDSKISNVASSSISRSDDKTSASGTVVTSAAATADSAHQSLDDTKLKSTTNPGLPTATSTTTNSMAAGHPELPIYSILVGLLILSII